MRFAFPFLFLFFTYPLLAATPETCETAPAARVSAEQMSKTLCEAAQDGRLQPSTDSLLSECGVGFKDAAVAVGNGMYNGAVAVKDMGVAAVSKSAAWVASFWADTDEAGLAAQKVAEANTQEDKSWLQTVSDYASASQLLMQTFLDEFDHNVRLISGSMMCLPWKIKIKYFCQFVSHVALELLACKGVAVAADKSVAAGRAVAEFMRKSNMVEEMRGLGMTARLKAAGEALEAQSQYKVVEKFGEAGNLRERIDPITHAKTLHFEEIAVRDDKKISVMRDIPRDAKTGAVDANFEYGSRLAKLTAEKSKGDHLVFIDVNNLGKVNYFKGGTQAGDEYLTAVSNSIRKNLRADDRFFKNGGDELVIVLKTKDPAEVVSIMNRIHKSIDEDQMLQALFRQERAAVAADIKRAAVPPTPEQIHALQETAKIRPSVSIGSTKIQGDWAGDLARAEKQAGEIKAKYKADIGLETLKYKVDGLTPASGPPRFTAKPRVLEPAL